MDARSSSNGSSLPEPATVSSSALSRDVNRDIPAQVFSICNECHRMTRTTDGLFRLMTCGYMHKLLRWTYNDVTIPPRMARDVGTRNTNETDGRSLPASAPPELSNIPPLGYGCQICSIALSAPKASRKGSEVIHPSVFYKYNKTVAENAANNIRFHAIITDATGRQVGNPFKDRIPSIIHNNGRFINSTGVAEYLAKMDIQIRGFEVRRGGEVITRIPFNVPIKHVFGKRLHSKLLGRN